MNEVWMKKMWYIYSLEYYSALKKEQDLAICDIDDLEGVLYLVK